MDGAGAAVPNRVLVGVTIPDNEQVCEQYPDKRDMTKFRVRQVGYSESNKKDVSGDPLYSCFARDCFSFSKKRYHVGELLELPELPPDLAEGVAGVPPYIVLNVMLPNYQPSKLYSNYNGEGWSYTFYFVMTKATREWLHDLDNAPASVRTLHRFITVDDHDWRDRLKIIASLLNPEETKFGRLTLAAVNKYNMKPFLSRPQHKFFKGPSYFEIDIDVHEFGYIPRSTWQAIKANVAQCKVDFGLTIEGRDDSELPEVMMLSVRHDKYNLEDAVPFEKAQALSDEQRERNAAADHE
mmetsp:Transcript_28747/g.75456  ORF Transcript_28747/g.75456 Transcript_28747/m.75456 type:complete len:296 (-) Transcript_28747:179-1066(-)